MTDSDPRRLSSDTAPRPPSLRSASRQAASPSPQLPAAHGSHRGPGSAAGSAAGPRSRLPSTEIPAATPPPALPDESTIKPGPVRPARPRFQPLFTLVSDATARGGAPSTHHPRVHYVFADDDPYELARALDAAAAGDDGSEAGSRAGAGADRAILLDLVPAADGAGPGYEVAAASSLSPDWAVTAARVDRMEGSPPPSSAGAAGAEEGGALVLRIEGLSLAPDAPSPVPAKTPSPSEEMQSSDGSGRAAAAGPPPEDYGLLMDEFDRRMGVLRKVVEVGEERRRTMSAPDADEQPVDDDAQRRQAREGEGRGDEED